MNQAFVTSTDRLLNVPGGTIFSRQWTTPAAAGKIPLILLHDSIGCVELWRDFPATLAERLQVPVIAYDRLGYGQSSGRKELPKADFIYVEAERTFPEVVKALGISEFFLLGHSAGGTISLVVASRMADACHGVVSIASQSFIEDRTIKSIETAKKSFEPPEQLDRLKKYHGEKAKWVVDAWTEVWLLPEFRPWTLEKDLPRIRCPILVMHGDTDEFGSIKIPEYIRDRTGGPVEMHIFKYCGHLPHRQQTEKVLNLITQSPIFSTSNASVRRASSTRGKEAMRSPIHRTSPQGRTVGVVGDVYRFLATGQETEGKYAQWEAIVLPGGGPPPHVHSREEEGFFVLEGEITFNVSGERVVATPGTFVNMPIGVVHGFKNETTRSARMIITVAPAGIEQMFYEIGVPLAEGATSAAPPTKEEIEKLMTLAPKYGIEIKVPGH
jgi:pimeloyl-ACP methyl ester carboxylesterase/quercetin dioxygenase-like cupin family protein